MPCLYCGKELALLKRLRGGGEFCSEAHRLRYREEFNELALNRLLQAKPENEPAIATEAARALPDASPSPIAPNGARPAFAPPSETGKAPIAAFAPAGAPQRSHHSPANYSPANHPPANYSPASQSPAPAPREPEVKAPAPPAGYIVDRFEAKPAESRTTPPLPESAPAMIPANAPALPTRVAAAAGDASSSLLTLAGQVEIGSCRAADATHSPRGRNIEVREFVRSVPFTPVAMDAGGITMLSPADTPVEVDVLPYEPPETGPWLAPEREFAMANVELGELVRVLFETTGFEGADLGASSGGSAAVSPGPILAKLTRPSAALVSKHSSSVRVEPVVVEFVTEAGREREDPAAANTPGGASAITKAGAGVPGRSVTALRIPSSAMPAGRGRPVQIFSAPLVPSGFPKIPQLFPAIPMRPRMVWGPAPETAEQAAAPAARVEPPAPSEATPAKATPAEVTPPETRKSAGKASAPLQSAPATTGAPAKAVTYKSAFLIPADAEKPPATRTAGERKQSRPAIAKTVEPEPKSPPKPSAPSPFITPSTLKTFKRDELVSKESPSPFAKVKAGESKRLDGKPVVSKDSKAPDAKVADSKLAELKDASKAAEAKSSEAKASEPVQSDPKPLPKPTVIPEPDFDLGLPTLSLEPKQGFWTKLPMGARIGLAAGVVVALVLAIYLSSGGAPATAKSRPVAAEQGPLVRPGSPIMDAVWVADWAPDTNVKRNRRISILKTSAVLTDYRVQFEAQIENKAIAWIYRAADPKNYYVNKIEVVKAGLEPEIALVRFALVNGQETSRNVVPLDLKVRVDTLYKVRFEAVGNQFTTWLQDRKVDQYTDSQFASGGPGLYSEQGESEALRGTVNVIPLVVVQTPGANRAKQK